MNYLHSNFINSFLDNLPNKHPVFTETSVKLFTLFTSISALFMILGIIGGIVLLFAGEWKLIFGYIFLALLGKLIIGILLMLPNFIFLLPAINIIKKGIVGKIISTPLFFLNFLFSGSIVWYFNMFIFKVSLFAVSGRNYFLVICATMSAFCLGMSILSSMSDKNSIADLLNLNFYGILLTSLYGLFMTTLITEKTVIFIFFIFIVIKALIETVFIVSEEN